VDWARPAQRGERRQPDLVSIGRLLPIFLSEKNSLANHASRDHPLGGGINEHRKIQPALCIPDIEDVRTPFLVFPFCYKVYFDEILHNALAV
jgi:hypothetical protein